MKEPSMNRIPLVLDRDKHPFVFHNPDLNRLEFVHGNTIGIIQLVQATPVMVMPPVGSPGFQIREEEEAREHFGRDGRPVYAKQAADYGTEIRDSRGHTFCSLKEYGPEDDIIITVKRDKRHYYIYFPYSPWQSKEERLV